MTLFYPGIVGARGANPTKIVIHNDAGSRNATAAFYKGWLPTRDAESGFAHYYVASDGIYQAEDPMNMAWHCANPTGNAWYIGIEVCQQLGDLDTFLSNEQKAFKLAAQLCKQFNIPIDLDHFPLHCELSSTSCPERSKQLHGTNLQTRQYFVDQVKKYANGETPQITIQENPIKACLDSVNLNSQAFLVKGWLLHKKNDLKNTTPWLFFVDPVKDKELYRVKGKWTSRSDVAAVFPNPQNANVGVEFSGATPKVLNEGQKYCIMLRASDEKGNVSYAENWFDSNFAQNPKVDTGNLDLFKLENGKLRAAGWHLASNQKQGDYHYLFIMDRETNKEITRYDITANSYQKSDDVKKAFNNNQLAQANKCRFDASVDVKDVLKNKNVYVMSRYCYDPLGNDGVSGQYSFKDTVIFI